jgi:hypothetical protein
VASYSTTRGRKSRPDTGLVSRQPAGTTALMARSPFLPSVSPVLSTLAVIAAIASPAFAAAREQTQVQVQRSRPTLAMADGLRGASRLSLSSVAVTRSRGVRVMRGSAGAPAESRGGGIDDAAAPWVAPDTIYLARDYPAFYLPARNRWAGYPVGLAGGYAALSARTDDAWARPRKLRRPMLRGAAYPEVPQASTVYRGAAYGNVARSLVPALSAR